ncbi:MAG TPA: FAD-dependent oxidoreductase [Solirubrobacteraceae bacterium]|nr:FAD-dependent oxidoreductase [Solirubrobacteraceae bacterium]
MATRLAIVGGDAAGMSAASTAHRRDAGLEVVAFERGPYTSYSACGIPYYVGGLFDDSDRLISRSPDEHRANGIAVHVRTEVTAIDLDARTLTVRDHQSGEERSEGFDIVVLATGAEAVAPPIPGAEATEPVRTVDAAERFRVQLSRGRDSRHAVVIGGGYIGIEMAEALVQRDIATTLIEAAPQVMGTLDPDMAAHVQDAAEGVGIRVLVGTEVDEILLDGAGAPRAVRAGGETIDADHVVMATGVRPAVALAEAAGIECGPSGAVRVDDHQRCHGHDGVFAAGDCVESWHRLLRRPVNVQLGTHANKQGRIAGANATGGDLAFPGVIGTAVSRLCRYEVARTGLSEREAGDAGIDVVTAAIKDRTRAGYFPGAGPIWVKLVCEPATGRLLGGQIVGVEGAAKRIDVLATCVWAGLAVDEIELLDLGYAPPYSGVYDPVLVAARAAVKALA